jgi:hypothetical protein
MCTVGSVFEREPGRLLVFKQCDLAEAAAFVEPEVRRGDNKIRYVMFERAGANGPWAGFNNKGVLFVAADAYLDPDENPDFTPHGDVLEAYAHLVSHCRTAQEAVEHMQRVYDDLNAPDMVLIADREHAFLIECSPSHGVRIMEGDEGYLACTNHFRMVPGAVTEEDNPSTYRRLERAQEILDGEASLAGVAAVLRDQEEGPTELSICRVAQEEGDYFTQASVVFCAHDNGKIDCFYLLNGNPLDTPFTRWRDVFGASRRTRVAGPGQLDGV